jgi:hypothetical protein
MTAHLSFVLLAAALAADPPPAVQTVEAQGEAAVVNGDEGAAIEQAKEAALRDAVSKVAGTLVSSDTLTDGSILVSDRIYAHSAGYVRKWEYVGKPSVADGSATVTVRAEVGTAQLDKDLEAVRALLERKNKPRTVLLIAEQNVGTTEPFAWWAKGQKQAQGGMVSMDIGTFENSFIAALQKYGWNFVDHQVLDGKLKVNRPVVTELTNQDAIEFGKLASADLAIVGSVVAQSPGQSDMAPGMFAAHANLSLRAVNCDNGAIVDTVNMTVGDITTLDASAENAGIKALRMAAKKAALQMQQEILARWGQDANGTASISMKVTGLPNHRTLKSFEAVLSSSVRGVRAVREQTYDGSEAALMVDVLGDPQMLADQIDGKTIKGGLAINVRHVSGNELDVQLAR